MLLKVGRPNILDHHLICKVKDIAIGTRQAGVVINKRQIVNKLKVLLGKILLIF